MPTNYTPLTNGQDAIADTFNAPLTQLDTAIENLVSGAKALANPTIPSFVNATHTHQNAAGGGKLTSAAVNSGAATNGQVLAADGAGNAAWITIGAVPTGAILPYGGTSAPTGWLLCDGAAISRTLYAALFAVLGGAFGSGDGSTTFNLPDLRGRFPLGKDNMGGSSANRVTAAEADTLGLGAGAESHTLTAGEAPNINGGVRYTLSTGGVHAAIDRRTDANTYANDTNLFNSLAGGGAHNNMPPYQTVNYIIKI